MRKELRLKVKLLIQIFVQIEHWVISNKNQFISVSTVDIKIVLWLTSFDPTLKQQGKTFVIWHDELHNPVKHTYSM